MIKNSFCIFSLLILGSKQSWFRVPDICVEFAWSPFLYMGFLQVLSHAAHMDGRPWTAKELSFRYTVV